MNHLTAVAHDRAADILAAVTGALFGLTLASTLQVVQILAGLMTLVVGGFAIRYYRAKTREVEK